MHAKNEQNQQEKGSNNQLSLISTQIDNHHSLIKHLVVKMWTNRSNYVA